MGWFSDLNKKLKDKGVTDLTPGHAFRRLHDTRKDVVGTDEELGFNFLDPADVFKTQEAKEAKEAEERAAAEQEEYANTALGEYQRQFDIGQENLAPWLEAGKGALGMQQDFLGLSGGEAQQAAYDNYSESPGQKFLRERGEKAIMRHYAGIGGLGGGGVRSALNKQGIGFAAQDFGNHYNRLAGMSNTGQTTGQQMSQQGQNFANQSAGQYGLIGNARASGIYGAQQADAQGMSGFRKGLGAIGSYFTGGGVGSLLEGVGG